MELSDEQIEEIIFEFTFDTGITVSEDLINELVPYLTKHINLKIKELIG